MARGLPAIRQRRDRKGNLIDCWESQVNTGNDPVTGKPVRIPVYGKSYKECKDKLIEALNSIRTNTYVAPSKLTVGEWMDTWLKEFKRKKLRPTTYTSYEALIRVHIKKELGS
jgi:hypothetical protein